jgi:hypothetical protein
MTDEFERIWKEAVVALLKYYPTSCLEWLENTTENPGMIAGVSAEIRTKQHPNTGLERYRYNNLGEMVLPLDHGDEGNILT